MAEFDESKHPRDNDGKFTSKDGVKEYRQNTSYAEILAIQNDTGIIKSKKSIRGLKKQIEKHERKIETPEVVYSEWENLTEIEKARLKNHWEKEIEKFKDKIVKIEKDIREYNNE